MFPGRMQFKRDRSPDWTDSCLSSRQLQSLQCNPRGSRPSDGDKRFASESTEKPAAERGDGESRLRGRCECHVTGCGQSFACAADFEEHYRSCHSFVCRYCRRFYPTDRQLEIHLLETHDSLFSLLAQRQPMFQCLEQTCQERFMASESRDKHLLHCHGYRAGFKFDRRQQTRAVDVTGGLEENRDVGVKGHRRIDVAPQQRIPDTINFGIGGSKLFCELAPRSSGGAMAGEAGAEDPMDAT